MMDQFIDTIRYQFTFDTLLVDDRKPIYQFTIFWNNNNNNTKYAIYAPKWEFFYQMLLLLLLQVFFQCCMAIVIYKCIVQQRRLLLNDTSKDKVSQKKFERMDTSTMIQRQYEYTLPYYSYMLGWGIIIPFVVLILPYQFIDILHVYNTSIRMSIDTTAFIVAFRCIEAMYYTSPPVVEYNIYTYMIYYTSLLHFQWDPITKQRRKITLYELIINILNFVKTWIVLSTLYSYLYYYNFIPFTSSPIKELHQYHLYPIQDIFHIGHLCNMYLLAVLTYLVLAFGFEITSIGEQVKGYYTVPIFHNPMFTSCSPSDFWNRKWNNMIHTILKYGTFYPLLQFCKSKRIALLLTFIMSGLIHEHVWSIMFYKHPTFQPKYMKLTAFFLWNGTIMLLERPISYYKIIPSFVTNQCPIWFISTMIILTTLPISHWFIGDWVVGNFFQDVSHGLWMIKKVS